jgi:MoaA/NifB/PqqE/SkfB family radical SAM enzyme
MKKPFRRVFIEITNACNLACAFCASSSRPKTHMPLPLFESAAAQAGELAEVVFLHVLGEPLMHPEFPAVLAACSRLGLKVNLVTNGLLLNRFGPAVFAEKCLGQVSISLHALSCLAPSLQKESLAGLLEFARRKPEGLIVSFRLRGDQETAFFRETKAALLAALAGGGAGERVRDGLKLRAGVYLNFGSIFDWPGGPGGKVKKGCLGLRHHFGILSDGRVVPCCADFDGALALGSVKDSPLADILSSPAARALQASIAGKTPMPAYCASCGFTAPDS